MITLTETELELALMTYLAQASRCILVLDIATPFLEEALPPLAELAHIVEVLDGFCREVVAYVEPMVGSCEDAISRIPTVKSLSRRGLLLDRDSVPRIRIPLYTQGFRKTFEIEIINLRLIGTTLLYSIPRSCDIPPLLTPSALYAYYIVDGSMRDLVKQGFIASHYNIALILKAVPLELAILSLTKAISGDGPVYGYIDRLAKYFLVGKVPHVDIALALCLGYSLDDVYFVKILEEGSNIVKMLRLASHSIISSPVCRKMKRHSLYPYHRRLIAREIQHM